MLLLFLIVGALYVLYLDLRIRDEFEGKRWAVPARVFGRSLELYPGLNLTPAQFAEELALLNYQREPKPQHPGSFVRSGDDFSVVSRPFRFWDGAERSVAFRAHFSGGQLATLVDAGSGAPLPLVRMDPFQLASIVPNRHEDRVLVRRAELPDQLVHGLISVEDRHFYTHAGIDWRGLARAAWVNVKAMDVVQGGSTLTQQLVKNFFLSDERSFTRKANEAVMAVLLEAHYSKDEILEAYCNEVFLGQDGQRAIHGFGLGARFYFGNDLGQLRLPELALLVGLVKGPSYYDPRRHPERARERRDQVLAQLAAQGYISDAQQRAAAASPLGVVPLGSSVSRFPAYMDLVRRQLRRDYRDDDLRSEGLQIFTALDPLLQTTAERTLDEKLGQLEDARTRDQLQGAVVITSTVSGEVQALVGDREPGAAGFNRALAAERQIGSLVKPAVYLTALHSDRYTLITPIEDAPLTVSEGTREPWTPRNYDDQYHGTLPLYAALKESYNAATVRLGLDIGVGAVLDTLRRLGITRELPPFPSLLLGAVELTPFEVTQMYQTLAGGGFVTPLRAIRAVMSADGAPLQRYGLAVQQTVDAQSVYLVDIALQEAARSGTARSLQQLLPATLNVAGKTGTTNDLRDSWFAGFTGDRLAVVWVGRDDNRPAGLTGATGALRVWADIMRRSHPQALELALPEGVQWLWVEPASGLRASESCENALQLPFRLGTEPKQLAPCAGGGPIRSTIDWFKGVFQ